MGAGTRRKGLVGPLDDALGSDVGPGAGGHLAKHHQAEALQVAEVLPRGPARDQVRVGHEDPGRPLVGGEHPHGLPALHQKGFVPLQVPQTVHQGVEGLPTPGRPPRPAVDDEVLRPLRVLQVVLQHAQEGLLAPSLAAQLGPPGGLHATHETPLGGWRRSDIGLRAV